MSTTRTDYTGYTIVIGFLDGNLGDESCCAAASEYASDLEAAIQDAFPGADMTVLHQNAAGSPPLNYRAAVYTPEPEFERAENLSDRLNRIARDVYESYSWLPIIAANDRG